MGESETVDRSAICVHHGVMLRDIELLKESCMEARKERRELKKEMQTYHDFMLIFNTQKQAAWWVATKIAIFVISIATSTAGMIVFMLKSNPDIIRAALQAPK